MFRRVDSADSPWPIPIEAHRAHANSAAVCSRSTGIMISLFRHRFGWRAVNWTDACGFSKLAERSSMPPPAPGPPVRLTVLSVRGARTSRWTATSTWWWRGSAGPTQVLRNNGDGTWHLITDVCRRLKTRGFGWADLDGDGDPDAVFFDTVRAVLRVLHERARGSVLRSAPPCRHLQNIVSDHRDMDVTAR